MNSKSKTFVYRSVTTHAAEETAELRAQIVVFKEQVCISRRTKIHQGKKQKKTLRYKNYLDDILVYLLDLTPINEQSLSLYPYITVS